MISGDVVKRFTSSAVVIDWLPGTVVPPVLIVDAAVSRQRQADHGHQRLGGDRRLPAVGAATAGPFPVMAPPLVAGVALVLWQLHPGNTVALIPMVALFELRAQRRPAALAVDGPRRRAVRVRRHAVVRDGWSDIASLVVRNFGLCLLAIIAGDSLRARRSPPSARPMRVEQETLRRVGEERLEIAREIHDLVAHAMTAINVQAGVAAHLLDRDPAPGPRGAAQHQADERRRTGDLRSTLDVLPRSGRRPRRSGHRRRLGRARAAGRGLRTPAWPSTSRSTPVDDLPAPVQSPAFGSCRRH